MNQDAGRPVNARIDDPTREGLTGTAPANIYRPLRDAEQATVPPDGRPMDQQPAWRQAFPIDWPRDHHVERREFMKFMVLTSLAFTIGQFWIAIQSWVRRGKSGEEGLVRLAAVAEVPAGSTRTFTYPTEQDPCVLVRLEDGTFRAYGQKCTHLSCAVIPRVDEGVIVCPCHDGLFDLASGRPIAGPPRRPLSLVRLQLRDGDIYAAGVEERTV